MCLESDGQLFVKCRRNAPHSEFLLSYFRWLSIPFDSLSKAQRKKDRGETLGRMAAIPLRAGFRFPDLKKSHRPQPGGNGATVAPPRSRPAIQFDSEPMNRPLEAGTFLTGCCCCCPFSLLFLFFLLFLLLLLLLLLFLLSLPS